MALNMLLACGIADDIHRTNSLGLSSLPMGAGNAVWCRHKADHERNSTSFAEAAIDIFEITVFALAFNTSICSASHDKLVGL